MQLALNFGGFMDKHCAKKEYAKTDLTFKSNPAIYQIDVKKVSKDVHPLNIGKATFPPGIQLEAGSAPNAVCLFFSCKGGGSFKLNETWYHVKEHEFFVLPPGTITLLCADAKTGWTHRWITFTGTLSLDFLDYPTVFSLPEEFIYTLYDPAEEEANLAPRLTGDLYHIYAKMQKPKEKTRDHVQNIIDLINTSYMEKLTVTEMAKDLNLDRVHLSRLFKARMGVTIQEYILHFRISKAKQCLLSGHSVSDTALLCGFNDRVNFSRAFLKETSCSPTAWLKYIKEDFYNRPR